MVLTAVGLLSLSVCPLAAAQPVLTADQAIDAPVPAAALGDQQMPSVAWGGGVFLAVWQEGSSESTVLHAVRFDASGAVKDDPPLTVVSGATPVIAPAVAFDGAQFFVVWADFTSGNQNLSGARIDPASGAVGAPFAITSGAPKDFITVGGGGGWALPCWHQPGAGSSGVVACSLFHDGVAAPALANVVLSTGLAANQVAQAPSVTWGGANAGNFLVSWELVGDAQQSVTTSVWAALFSPATGAGAPAQLSTGTASAGGPSAPIVTDVSAASNGSTYVVYWADWRAGHADFEIWQRAVSFAGVPAASDQRLARSDHAKYSRPQATAWDGGFFVVWEAVDYDTGLDSIYGGRYDASGAGDGDGAPVSGDAGQGQGQLASDYSSRHAALAVDLTGHAVTVWEGALLGFPSTSGLDVWALATDLSTAGAMLPAPRSTLLSRSASYQHGFGGASNGAVALVVWEDSRNGGSTGIDVYGQRFGLDGQKLGAPIAIATEVGDQLMPEVAALPGGDFLVAWSDGQDLALSGLGYGIAARRVSAAGALVDSAAIRLASDARARVQPALAAKADGWLLAWTDWRQVFSDYSQVQVWSAVVSASGVAGGPALVAATACAPSAAFDGQRFFVAYESPCGQFGGDALASGSGSADVKGRWLSPAGAVEGDAVTLAALADPETEPRAASDGKSVYVAWRQRALGGDRILASAIADAAATPGSPVVLRDGAGTREAPALGFAAPGGGPSIGLAAWIETSPRSVQAVRLDGALAPLEPAFALASGASYQRDAARIEPTPALNGAQLPSQPLFTPPPALALAPTGELLAAYTLLDTLSGQAVPRVHYRALGLQALGGACAQASSCAQGFCTHGACCDAPCDGICQACGAKGCIEVPASDERCPEAPVSCAALSTACRTFTDPPANRCSAFGECAVSRALSECTDHTDAADGTACDCGGAAGVCLAGGCACMSAPGVPYARKLPSGGCSFGGASSGAGGASGGEANAGVLVLALASLGLLVVRRRAHLALGLRRRGRLALVLAVAAGGGLGCGARPGTLVVTLHLDDQVFVATHHARLIVTTEGGFPSTMSAASPRPGLTVANFDADGDGLADVVLELAEGYAFDRRDQEFRLIPDALPATRRVRVQAESYDAVGNRFAYHGAPSVDPLAFSVEALLEPGSESVARVSPQCYGDCSDPTLTLSSGAAWATLGVPGQAVTALAAGRLSGPGRSDLAASHAHEPLGDRPNVGAVWVWAGGPTAPAQPAGAIVAGHPGDELGAALAIADLDGDGTDDLAIGAPGVADGAGAVYVLYGPIAWPQAGALGLDPLPASASVIAGGAPGDRLGAALAFTSVDGQPVLLAGADGKAAIYALSAAQLPRGQAGALSGAPSVLGPAGSRLGASLAALGSRVAAGAPTELDGSGQPNGAVYLFDPQLEPAGRWLGPGGGFGTRVALAFLDGASGAPSVIASSPESGSVLVLPPGDVHAGDLTAAGPVLRSSAGLGRLGASLARLPWPGGDALLVGAPADAGGATSPSGAAFAVRGPTLALVPELALSTERSQAAVRVAGSAPGDRLGSQLTVGDFTQDGFDDLAVAASGARAIYLFRGPWL